MIAIKPRLKTQQKDFIICPLCNRGKLIFEDTDADDIPIRLILPGSKRKAKYYLKCDVCKEQVGFSFKK